MHIENNHEGWDIMDGTSYFNPNDYCNLTELLTDTIAALMAFQEVLKQIDVKQLKEPEQIAMYNSLVDFND